jgi:hypothetical protein
MLHSATEFIPRILSYQQYAPPYIYHPTSSSAINLLFEKLLIFSPLLSSSKYIVGATAIARLFVANVSKQKPSAHFIAMAEMAVRSA